MIRKQIITEAQKLPQKVLKENNVCLPDLCNKSTHAAPVAATCAKKGGRTMTNTQKQTIMDMRRRGMSYSAIAAAHRLSTNTIKSFCRRENIDVQSNLDDKKRKLCKNCGATLMHHPGSKKKTFCCDKCRYAWWNKNRGWTGVKSAYHLTCFYCGTEFDSNNKKRKYCGRECYIRSRYGEGLP
jgi:hypothetical protein